MTETEPSQVFLSYSEENEPFVESLARRLRDDTHLSFWFRPWHAIPGKDLQAQMEQALGEAQACAVFLGTVAPEGLQNRQMRDIIEGLIDNRRSGTQSYHVFIDSGEIRGWQNEQMRAAIQSRVEDDPAYRVIPVLLPGTARPDKRDLPRFLRLYEPVEFRSPDDEQAFRYLLAGILGIPPIEVEGFLETRAEAVPAEIVETTIEEAELPLPEPAFEPLHIDPDDPPLPAIRDLLLAAFQPADLRTFCQDRRQFRDIVYRFSPSHGLIQMVGDVIDYCGNRNLWDELLAEVAKVNPRQYARFEPQLRDLEPPA